MAQRSPPLVAAGMRYLSSETTKDISEEEPYGVHVPYEEIYNAIVFLIAIYAAGFIFSRFLRMPALVGEIIVGMLLGPELLNTFVPYPAAFVLLGQIGLILLVLEAGIDIDLATLKMIGPPGFLIGTIGSMVPIGIGVSLALAMGLSTTEAIAAGASFGATSVGITMNILRGGGIINTPVGQLIIAAAVIDDMIALIVLSELQALIDPTIPGIVIPIVSALAFLFIGGFIAVVMVPVIMGRYILPYVREELRGRCSLAVMIILLLALMPATTYSKASYLMGAFLAGLAFCSDHDLHIIFVSQFKRVMQWLLRIFFACSIGFQIPIKTFGDGQVIWKGCVFTLALIGKFATGLLVPNFHGHHMRRYSGLHRTDCTIVGCSMAAEGEFAFVIAVFGVENNLTDNVTYAAIILAVLLSTIIAPFSLRMVISKSLRQGKKRVEEAEAEILSREEDLEKGIRENRVLFLCIQIRSEPAWGLLSNILRTMVDLDLEVIDSRSWHPEHEVTVNVNEIYVQDSEPVTDESSVHERIAIIKQRLFAAIGQKDAKVKVERWIPYAVTALEAQSTFAADTHNDADCEILHEARDVLDSREQIDATDILEKIDGDATVPQDQPLGLRSRPTKTNQLSLTELVFQEAKMNLDEEQKTAGSRLNEAEDTTATRSSPNLDGVLRWSSSLHEAEDSTAVRPSPNLVGLVRRSFLLDESSDTTTTRPSPGLDGFARRSSPLRQDSQGETRNIVDSHENRSR